MIRDKKKIFLLAIILFFIIVASISYAYWTVTHTQEDENIIGTSCLSLSFESLTNGIDLQKTYPISDEEGMGLDGYTFKISNRCSSIVSYGINLESLTEISSEDRINLDSLDYTLNNVEVINVNSSSLQDVDSVLDDGASYAAKRIKNDKLAPNESKVYTLRVWVDKYTSNTQMNKVWKGKITLNGELINAADCDIYPIYRMGDMNMDGIINAADLSYFEQWMSLGTSSTYFNINQKSLADVNFDGRLDSADVSYFQQYYLNDYATRLFFKGDLNKDGSINSSDVALLDINSNDNTIKILGDINLDGILDNKDIIYLNKYIEGNCSSSESGSSTQEDEVDSIATFITNLYSNGDTSLALDNTTNNNLRYIGNSPSNYVWYNNKRWRIIGVMNNIKGSSTAGNDGETRVKIISTEVIDDVNWGEDYSVAKWNGETLSSYLNNEYLSNIDLQYIDTATYYLGGYSGESSNSNYLYSMLASDWYINERSNNVYGTNPKEWTEKVGLMYPSDYAFATGGSTRSSCLNGAPAGWAIDLDTANCVRNNWLYNEDYGQWTITPAADYELSYDMPSIAIVGNSGEIRVDEYYSAAGSGQVARPVVYLKKNVQIINDADHNGTYEKPYGIK